jgi:hypothetical protein
VPIGLHGLARSVLLEGSRLKGVVTLHVFKVLLGLVSMAKCLVLGTQAFK